MQRAYLPPPAHFVRLQDGFSLYMSCICTLKGRMLHTDRLFWWFVGLIVFSLFGLLLSQLSPNARLRRRRRKSHTRIVSKSGRPTVRFSVRPPKDK